MAIFSSKKNTKAKSTKAVVAKDTAVVKEGGSVKTSFIHIIKKPRITEKAGIMSEANVYTFEVDKTATKGKVMHAINELYKVTPVRVNIVNLPAKRVFVRGKNGSQPAIKKALVFLKEGDKIELV